MSIFYSTSAHGSFGGFFDDQLHGEMPADAVKISAKTHKDLLAGQAGPHFIAANARGKPMLKADVEAHTS